MVSFLLETLRWIDIGIMNQEFANNYLINLPKKDIKGTIIPQNNFQRPLHQMNHLSRKILKAIAQKDNITAKIFSYRYISWKKVNFNIKLINDISLQNMLLKFNNDISIMNDNEILEYVLNDIEQQLKKI